MTPEERKAYNLRWNAKNRERILEQRRQWRIKNPQRVRAWQRRWHEKIKNKTRVMKSELGCKNCGNIDPRVLDFHHRNPADKKFCIGNHTTSHSKAFLGEIAKCDVLCANCHRIVEWEKSHDAS